MSTSTPNAMAEHRRAALQAAEARLRGTASPSAAPEETAPKVEEVFIQPSEKEDAAKKREFARLLDRGIIRDNGYEIGATCVETLLKISSNILSNPTEPKYRVFKSTNAAVKHKILAANGGHAYIIALGFRVRTIDHVAEYYFDVTLKRMHLLKLGNEVLQEHLPRVIERLNSLHQSQVLYSADEAERKARALREIEADRELVKDRVERERLAREARELVRRQREEEEAKRALEEASGEASEVSGSPLMPGHHRLGFPASERPSRDDGSENEDEWHPSQYGPSRKLGE